MASSNDYRQFSSEFPRDSVLQRSVHFSSDTNRVSPLGAGPPSPHSVNSGAHSASLVCPPRINNPSNPFHDDFTLRIPIETYSHDPDPVVRYIARGMLVCDYTIDDFRSAIIKMSPITCANTLDDKLNNSFENLNLSSPVVPGHPPVSEIAIDKLHFTYLTKYLVSSMRDDIIPRGGIFQVLEYYVGCYRANSLGFRRNSISLTQVICSINNLTGEIYRLAKLLPASPAPEFLKALMVGSTCAHHLMAFPCACGSSFAHKKMNRDFNTLTTQGYTRHSFYQRLGIVQRLPLTCQGDDRTSLASSSPSQTESDPTSEQAVNVVFASQDPPLQPSAVPGGTLLAHPVIDTSAMPEGEWSIRDIMNKPILTGSQQWAESYSLGQIILALNLPGYFFGIPDMPNSQMYKLFTMAKMDFHIRVIVRGTNFHQGLLVVYEVPLQSRSTSVSAGNFVPFIDPANATVLNHALLDASESTEVDIVIPYKHLFNYLNLENPAIANFPYNDFSTVYFQVFVPLEAATGASSQISFSTFVGSQNALLHWPLSSHTLHGLEDLLGDLTDVASAATSFISGDYGSALSKTVKLGAKAVKVISNRDKPLNSQDPRTNSGSTLIHGVGHDNSVRLDISPLSQTITPADFLGYGGDHMALLPLLQRPSLMAKLTVSSNAGGLGRIASFPITPHWGGVVSRDATNSEVRFNHTNLSYLASPFAMYRGSFKYTFRIVSTSYHKGSFRVSHSYETNSLQDTAGANALPATIFSIGTAKEFSHVVPWSSTTAYKRISDRPYIEQSISSFPSSTFNTPSLFESVGNLYVDLVNDITISNNVPNTITILVFVSACSDFELCYPRFLSCNPSTLTFPDLTPAPTMVVQGDEGGVISDQQTDMNTSSDPRQGPTHNPSATTDINHFFSGSNYMNIKDLIRRYNFIFSDWVNSDVNRSLNVPVTPVLDMNTAYFNAAHNATGCNSLLAWYSRAFLFWRGSLRFKFFLNADVFDPVMVLASYNPFAYNTNIRPPLSIHNGVPLMDFNICGFHYDISMRKNVCEVEVPFIHTLNSCLIRACVPSDPGDARAAYMTHSGQLTFQWNGNTTGYIPKHRLFYGLAMAAGDDFQLGYYLGPATMTYSYSALNYTVPSMSVQMHSSAAGAARSQSSLLSSTPTVGTFRSIKNAVTNINEAAIQATQFFADPQINSVAANINAASQDFQESAVRFNNVADNVNNIVKPVADFMSFSTPAEAVDSASFRLPAHLASLSMKVFLFVRSSSWLDRTFIFFDSLLSFGLIAKLELKLINLTKQYFNILNPPQVPKDIDITCQGDDYCPADIASAVGASLLTVASLATVGTFPSKGKIGKGLEDFGKRMRSLTNITSGAKSAVWIFEQLLSLFKSMCEYYISDSCPEYTARKLLDANADKFLNFIKDVNELNCEEIRSAATVDPATRNRVFSLRAQADELLSVMSKLPREGSQPLQVHFSRCLNVITKISDEVKRVNLILPSRIAPYCLWLHGEKGTGKSLFSTMINQILCADEGSRYTGCVYPRALDDQYWSNYIGQPGVCIDDLGAERGVSSYNQWTNFITLVSNVPKALNMASLEEKGRMFTSTILTVSSNTAHPKPPEITCHEALWRRRNDLIEVSRADGNIGGDYQPNQWRFRRMSPLSPGAYLDDKVYTFDEIVPFIRKSCKDYLALQRSTLSSATLDIEALIHSTPALTLQGLEPLHTGDIIEFDRGAYKHYAIVYSPDANPSQSVVAHKVAGPDGKPVVCTSTLRMVAADAGLSFPSAWCVNNFTIAATARNLRPRLDEEIRKSIASALGTSTYDPINNNCEHFVTHARYGEAFCLQVDKWYEPSLLYSSKPHESLSIVATIINTPSDSLYDKIRQALVVLRAHLHTSYKSLDSAALELGHYYIHLIKRLYPAFNPYSFPEIDAAMVRFTNPYVNFFSYCAINKLDRKATYYTINYAVKKVKEMLANNLSTDALDLLLEEDNDFYSGCCLINSIFHIDLTSWDDSQLAELARDVKLVEETIARIDTSNITRISRLRITGKAVIARTYKLLFLDKVKKWMEDHPYIVNMLKVLGFMIAGVGVFFGLKALFAPEDKVKLQGKYQVEKNRVANRVVKQSIRATALTTQGTVDQNADDVIDFKVKPNLVRIAFYDPNSNAYIYGQVGVRLTGHLVLLNAHAFNRIQEGDIIEATLSTGLVVQDVVELSKLIRYAEKDLVVFCFNARMPCAKNIVNKFITEDDLPYINSVSGSVCWTDDGVSHSEQLVEIKPFDHVIEAKSSVGIEKFRKGWEYDARMYAGTCGGVLLQHNAKAPRKLLGIHAASHDHTNYCIAECVTQEILNKMISHFPPQVSGLQLLTVQGDTPLEGDLTFIRKVPRLPTSRRTKIRPSLIHGVFSPVTAPAILYKNDPRNVSGAHPLFKAINKYSQPLAVFDVAFLNRAIESVSIDLINDFPPLRKITQLPSESEALNGLPCDYYEPMDMKTSPGYPYILSRPPNASGKAYLFADAAGAGEPHIWSVKDPLLRLAIDNRLKEWKNGCVVEQSYFTDCSKDERLPFAKIEAGKTRAFCMPPVDFTICGRPYFQDFASSFYKHHLNSFSAVGINCESPEWTKLYQQLQRKSDIGIGGDYSRYDGTIPGDIIWASIVCIDEWYKHYYQNSSTEDSLVRFAIAEEMIHTQSIAESFLYQKHQGNPSGCFLTVILNTIVGEIYLRYIYLYIMHSAQPDLATVECYREHICSKIYGDDNIIAISPLIKDYFNGRTLTEAFAHHGIEYTNATKTGSVVEYLPLHELTFLKRGFKPHPSGLMIYAPISIFTIQELCNWVTDCNDPQVALYDNLRDALSFAFHHGVMYFNNLKHHLNKTLTANKLSPLTHSYLDFSYQFCRLFDLPPDEYKLQIPEIF